VWAESKVLVKLKHVLYEHLASEGLMRMTAIACRVTADTARKKQNGGFLSDFMNTNILPQ
jgi:hypothetical protein